MNIIASGGAGFIDSAVACTLFAQGSADVVVLDKLSYAGNMGSLVPGGQYLLRIAAEAR